MTNTITLPRSVVEQPDMGNLSSAPEGWKLVPVEPTRAMMDAYARLQGRFNSARSDWAAMLSAAPQPPVVEPLTDAQIADIEDMFSNEFGLEAKHAVDFARAIERAHKIGGEDKEKSSEVQEQPKKEHEMTDTINNGGPAFPVTLFEGQTLGDGTANGMTLRDYFAAKAMQGILANPDRAASSEQVAQEAYKHADAMLRARGEA